MIRHQPISAMRHSLRLVNTAANGMFEVAAAEALPVLRRPECALLGIEPRVP